MNREGPTLESLTRRLAETPPDFLDEPRIGTSGRVHVAAVVNDLLRLHGATAAPSALAGFGGSDPRTDRNRLALVLIAAWLLADDWFRGARVAGPQLLGLLHQKMRELEAGTAARKFVSDPDRREELARLALAHLGYRPAGESEAQARDRLVSISTRERQRVLQASRAAEERARRIREALARKAAEESADKWSRE